MAIPDKHKERYFYHFTHVENLESIIQNGFLCTNEKATKAISHKNVALEDIQHRRSEMNVTCSPNGKVHDYVPFYFATTNPMLLSVTLRKNIDQPFMIFFAISIDKLLEENVVFTDSSANTNDAPNFFNDPKDLEKLDWESIDSRKWGSKSSDEKHKRMAEVLVHKNVPLEWINSIIVWNSSFRDYVLKVFKDNNIKAPDVTYQPFNGRYLYYTKFQLGRSDETLVTGPYFLKDKFDRLLKEVKTKRQGQNRTDFLFEDIKDALEKIEDNFCVLQELEDIFELETDNSINKENVSDHTKLVVEKLIELEQYKCFEENDQYILQLSAYLHDIGKGPKSKWAWNEGIQKDYPDHPVDAIPMLKRILVKEFKNLSEEEIRKVCLLVVYHDIVGEVLEKGRDIQQVIDIIEDENELDLLIALSLADISSINKTWADNVIKKIGNFKKSILAEL